MGGLCDDAKGESMSLYVSYEKKEYPQAPEGLHQAVCADVQDLGLRPTPWGDKEKIRIMYQTETVDPATKQRFVVMRQFGKNLSPKGHLRGFLESWRGRKFTPEELAKFDLETLIGVNCQIQVVHELSTDGREFANIQAIISLPKNTPKITVSPDFVRAKDRTEGGGNFEPIEEDVPF
jgi:hypothetical protein